MLTPKEYKEKADAFEKRYKEYRMKCQELESQNIEDDDEFNRLYDQLDEEYKNVYTGWEMINDETMVTKEFFNYFYPEFERKLFCLTILPYYGKKLEDGSTFKGIVFRNNFYYYLVEENNELHYYGMGDTEFTDKLEKLVFNTPRHRYIVRYTDAWDDNIHTLQAFDTEEEAKEFVAQKEHWKQEFKDEFGVDYDSLRESDFTDSMEDWLFEFVNATDYLEATKYFIDEI